MKSLLFPAMIYLFVSSCTKEATPLQTDSLQFSKNFGKAFGGTDIETVADLAQSSTSMQTMIGSTSSNNGDITSFKGVSDVWVIQTDINGNKTWQQTIGGSGEDKGLGLIENTDGSYMGVGFTNSTDGDIAAPGLGNVDALLFKLSSSGSLIWTKTYGGTGADFAASIAGNTDGTFIIAGSSSEDAWVYKVDAAGNKLWEKKYGGSGDDKFNKLIATTDGGYLLAGVTTSSDGDITGFHPGGVSDTWLLKIDASGNKVWTKTIGGSGSDSPTAVINSNDGGYIITGKTTSNDADMPGNHGSVDGYVIKLNASGTIVWQKSLGGTDTDWINAVISTTDNGYLLAVCSKSINGDFTSSLGFQDAWIVKIDAQGNQLGKQIIGGSAHDEITALKKNANGSYSAAGASQSIDGDISGHHGSILTDFWLIQFLDQ